MKINLFEGARRITLLVQILVVLTSLGFNWFSTPWVRLTYFTYGPDKEFFLANFLECKSEDGTEYINRKLSNGEDVRVQLCFRAQAFEQGLLVPYKSEKDLVWGDSKYSDNVSVYQKKRAYKFVLSDEAKSEVRKQWWKGIWKNFKDGISFAFFGLVGIALFSYVLGWIVRGFLGIPSGSDFRSAVTDQMES